MNKVTIAILTLAALMLAGLAWAGGPVAAPDRSLDDVVRESAPPAADKALGDPTDWLASCLAAADYLVGMQADITEDNAGNGASDADPDDGGWDWVTTAFEHSASASPANLYGAVSLGILRAYEIDGGSARFTAIEDAADHIVSVGPTVIRSGADMIFLLEFAELPAVTNPTYYQDGARAIMDYRYVNTGGNSYAGIAEAIRDYRYPSWPGLIPWDIAPYVVAAARLDALYPGNGYAAGAVAMAEVLYQDSFAANPGYFDPDGANQGADPTYTDHAYWAYSLGVSGLIRSFNAAGVHTAEIPGLNTLLLDCQYDDGAFSFQYGADPGFDDRDWQGTAYSVMCLFEDLPGGATNLAALRAGATYLASTQDVTHGAWIYSDTSEHVPEEGGECAVAAAYGWLAGGAAIGATADGGDPVTCGEVKTVTVDFTPGDATPGLRGYEIEFQVTGGVLFGAGDIAEGSAFDPWGINTYFDVVDMGGGVYSVNASILGATTGLLDPADLFSVALTTDSEGPVTFDILSYTLRDPDNTPIFADVAGTSFTVDCTASTAVFDITAEPGHNKVIVDWDHDGLDVATYAVFRGLWYDTTPGVSAYPEYDDLAGNVIPTRPVDYAAAVASAEWELAGTVAAGTLTYTDTGMADRGVYYYEVFAVDAALNGSAAAAANDRATSYWLGDVDGDGEVTVVGDITPLGNAFGTCDGDGGYDNVCDVGPTDDWSRVGIPTTDSCVDFEDLIVFAMNFGVVGSTKDLPTISDTVFLAWTRLDETRYALQLTGGEGLLGLRLQTASAVRGVSAGSLLAEQQGPVFLRNLGGGLDANLAVMGRGITGTGDLVIVESAREIAVEDLEITARGLDNREVTVSFAAPQGQALPTVFSLEANYPNPFNPQTVISFALPSEQDVRLAVYGIDGRLVRVLVDEHRDAGRHEVIWRGEDQTGRRAATGTYFYVIDAGDFHQVRKMSLIK